jgi:hypothetical protein
LSWSATTARPLIFRFSFSYIGDLEKPLFLGSGHVYSKNVNFTLFLVEVPMNLNILRKP